MSTYEIIVSKIFILLVLNTKYHNFTINVKQKEYEEFINILDFNARIIFVLEGKNL